VAWSRSVQLTAIASARRAIAVAAGKAARSGVRRLGRGNGTAIPGLVTLAIDPGALGGLVAEIPRGAVLVTGSNGKGTTCRMLAQVMRAAGLHPLLNSEGSNQRSGLATTMVAHASVAGHLPRDFRSIGLFEVDEGSFPEVMPHVVRPAAIVVTNLFRDQLDRYVEPAYTKALVERSLRNLPPDTVLVLNADDPRIACLAPDLPNPRLYFGIADTAVSRQEPDPTSDFPRCPQCGGELAYSCVFYAHLGHWSCTSCGCKRPEPAVSATRVELAGAQSTRLRVVTAATAVTVQVPLPGLYNAYNAVAAIAAAAQLQLAPAAVQAIETLTAATYRMERVEVDGRNVFLALAKNANGYTEVLRAVLADGLPKRMLLGLNTHPGKQPDTSWIWDVDFDALTGLVLTPVVSGNRAADLAVRLKYAGWVDPSQDMVVEPDPVTAFQAALAATSPGQQLWIVSTSVVLTQIRGWLRQQGYVRELWQEHAHEAQEASRQESRTQQPDRRQRWRHPQEQQTDTAVRDTPAAPQPVPTVPAAGRPAETVELPAADMPPLILAPEADRRTAHPAPAPAHPVPRQKSRGRKQDRRPEPRRTQTRPKPTTPSATPATATPATESGGPAGENTGSPVSSPVSSPGNAQERERDQAEQSGAGR